MEVIKTFWQNLSKIQKISFVFFLQALFIIIIIIVLNFTLQPKKHIKSISSEENFTLPIPDKNIETFKNALWAVISNNVREVDRSVLDDVTIREGSYEEIEEESSRMASFIVDIDSIKQTYKVSISWVTDSKSGLYDDVAIDCPPQSQMKYPETICRGMYNNTYSLDLYLPYQIDSPYKDEYEYAGPEVYIYGDESTHTITVSLAPCNNAEENKKKANDYLQTIPNLKDYQVEYVLQSGVDIICAEDL